MIHDSCTSLLAYRGTTRQPCPKVFRLVEATHPEPQHCARARAEHASQPRSSRRFSARHEHLGRDVWPVAHGVGDSAPRRVHRGEHARSGADVATPDLDIASNPCVLLVGGFSNSVTLSAFWRDGRTGSAFIVSRAQRLLKPVFVLLAVWIPLAVILTNIGMSRQLLGPATKLVAQPLWFIAVYFLVTALAPAMRTLHDRHRTHVPVVLAVGAIAIDALRFGFGTESFGYANLLFVWLFAQQLGFFYADGSLIRVRPTVLITTAALAFAMLIALTTFGPYPVSMVGLPGDKVSNMNPPTLCLLVLTIMQVALVLLARPALTRWLRRERSWTRIVALNGVIMTVFLWHLSAMLVVLTVLNHFNIAQPMAGTAMWWLTRPVWFAALIGALLPLVATFGKLERPTPNNAGTATPKRALTALGVFGVVVGIGGIAATDLVQLSTPGRAHVVILTMSTLQSIVLALLGAALLRPPRRSTPTV